MLLAVLTAYPILCVYCDANKGLALPVCTCVHAAVVTQFGKCLLTACADLLALFTASLAIRINFWPNLAGLHRILSAQYEIYAN